LRLKSSLTACAALLACLSLGGRPNLAHADTGLGPVVDDDLIVTATRSPQRRAEVAVSTTLITASQLEQVQAVIVSDVLSRSPGISVTRNGSQGSATQVRIRGAETEQTLVLIDGVQLNDPSMIGGGYNFANLLAADLERIEILRGPQSTLWGSQAIGGVVNILTARPSRGLSGQASLEAGSRATVLGRGAIGLGGDWGGLRVSASSFVTNGVSAFAKAKGGKESDGYRNTSASGRLDLNLSESLSLDVRAAVMRGKTSFDGYSPPAYEFGDTPEYGRTRDLIGYLGLLHTLGDGALTNRLGLSYTRTDRANYDPSLSVAKTFYARGVNSVLQYQGSWLINPKWQAVYGAASQRSWFRDAAPSEYDPSPNPERHAVRQDSVYGQIEAHPLVGLVLTAGTRHEEHQSFGGATTVQTGATYTLPGQATTLRANYGEGFKVPSLYQLYGDYGATQLTPERAKGWDIGLEKGLLDRRLIVSATVFSRQTRNQIDFVSCQAAVCDTRPFGLYANTVKALSRGLELSADFSVTQNLSLTANYTAMTAENRSPGDDFGHRLPRRANRMGALEASYTWPIKLNTSLAIQTVGDSYDDNANRVRLKGYSLLDIRASLPINDKIDLYGRIENLLDRHYQTLADYGTAGRGAFVGVRARF
jgi:vitamin B12 transporter